MIRSFIFSEGRLVGRDLELEALRLVRADRGLLLWVDLDDPTPEETKAVLEGVFAFHPLAIEDCTAPGGAPKLEDYDDYLFLVTQAVDSAQPEKFATSELDLFLGRDYLVTFHRRPLRPLQTAADRCLKSTGVVARGPDRLAHTVLDLLFDHYQPVADGLRGALDDIEVSVLARTDDDLTPLLLETRARITRLRQVIRPQRDLINRLAHGESKMIRAALLPYFRDLRDNLIRLDETAASQADRLLVAFDLYLSKSDFQANEGIKALTALTAITLPAMIVGTWYGMNFAHMPELRSPYGYPVAIAVTALGTLAMWRWCRKRKWI